MAKSNVQHLKTISDYHRSRGLPPPEHPLISLIDYETIQHRTENNPVTWALDFYSISLKRNFSAKIKYGQLEYDFDEGVLFFMAPGQVYRIESFEQPDSKRSGYTLLVHPDFLWNTSLSKTIHHYAYFDYAANEALFLSEKEESTMIGLLKNIRQEYQTNMDQFSQALIIAQLELFLTYAERFYQRQFITRKIANHKILHQLEELLGNYFNNESQARQGLPSVQYLAGALNVSPNYLSSLLKVLTGQSTQQHIHNKLIEKAKEQLTTTDLSVSEIAYALGFEHSQSFSRLFKSKTQLSPLAFRESFQ